MGSSNTSPTRSTLRCTPTAIKRSLGEVSRLITCNGRHLTYIPPVMADFSATSREQVDPHVTEHGLM